jgi:hypothetical protein
MIEATYTSNVLSLLQQIKTDAADILRADTNEIFGQSQGNVPVDDGELISSGDIASSIGNTNITFTISYGTDYAIIQHENPYYHHTNGTMKYLENPFNAVAPMTLDHLKDIFS